MKFQVTKDLNKWFSKTTGRGLNDILLVLSEKGIKIKQSDSDSKIRFVDALIEPADENIKKFEGIKDEIELPIVEFNKFMSAFDTFHDIIDIDLSDENKIILHGKNRRVTYNLVEKSYIQGIGKNPKLEYKRIQKIPTVFLQKVKKDISITGGDYVHIIQKDQNLTFISGENTNVKMEESIETAIKKEINLDIEASFFMEIIGNISEDEVEIGLENDEYPMMIKETGIHWTVINYLAPMEVDRS